MTARDLDSLKSLSQVASEEYNFAVDNTEMGPAMSPVLQRLIARHQARGGAPEHVLWVGTGSPGDRDALLAELPTEFAT